MTEHDVIVTGASRGIGRALARALAAKGRRLVLVARDAAALETLAREVEARGAAAAVVPGDLGSLARARALGDRLATIARPGAALVHNAGLWPSERVITDGGLEAAFVVNHLGGLALQAPLLDARRLGRIMVVSAGLILKGRFDPQRTPTGADFSRLRTYCTTKLCFAIAMRDVAAAHPEVDVVVLHPGVVNTGLGAQRGPIGVLLSLVKRAWESPDVCAERLARIFARERWSTAGEAKWLVEEAEQPWPEIADDPSTRDAVRRATARWLS
ncbi:MAG: SDR family NAD(P)-dependent oxidoreductase [Labilithrix sp.]|nr:SDR family NAD(P)-dependent oxidoreductase [Labilithrix sp.]